MVPSSGLQNNACVGCCGLVIGFIGYFSEQHSCEGKPFSHSPHDPGASLARPHCQRASHASSLPSVPCKVFLTSHLLPASQSPNYLLPSTLSLPVDQLLQPDRLRPDHPLQL